MLLFLHVYIYSLRLGVEALASTAPSDKDTSEAGDSNPSLLGGSWVVISGVRSRGN